MGSQEGTKKILDRDPDFFKKIGAKGGNARKNDTPKRKANRAIGHLKKAIKEIEGIRGEDETSKNRS